MTTSSISKPGRPGRPPRSKPVLATVTSEPVAAPEPPAAAAAITLAPSIPLPNETVTAMKTEMTHGYEELTAFGKANMEALVEANSIFVKGIEAISSEFFSLTRTSMEQAAASTKAMFAAKTLKDVVALNADFTKSQYERLLANSTRFGELTVKLATESSAPIPARAHRLVETVARPAV
jgi:phasin family protein